MSPASGPVAGPVSVSGPMLVPVSRPASPVVSFGFGGRLVVMFPRDREGGKKSKTLPPEYSWELPQPTLEEKSRWMVPGPVEIFLLGDILSVVNNKNKTTTTTTTGIQSLTQTDLKQQYNNNKNSNSDNVNDIMTTQSSSLPLSVLSDHELSLDLLRNFPGPLTESTSVETVKEYVGNRVKLLLSEQSCTNTTTNGSGTSGYVSGGSVSSTHPVILWQLLAIMLDCNFTLSSEVGSGDPMSPEIYETSTSTSTSTSNISYLQPYNNTLPSLPHSIIHPSTITIPNNSNNINNDNDNDNASLHEINLLLLHGQREKAALLAADKGHWAMALIIAGVCDKDIYQRIVRNYADKHFPIGHTQSQQHQHQHQQLLSMDIINNSNSNITSISTSSHSNYDRDMSSLHLLCLLFSNQAEGAIKYGGKLLLGGGGGVGGGGGGIGSDWRRTVASVVANKGSDWITLLRILADRLRIETKDIVACHFVLLLSGAIPGWTPTPVPLPVSVVSELGSVPTSSTNTNTSTNITPRPLLLLGCDMSTDSHSTTHNTSHCHCHCHRNLTTATAVAGLRMSEILEWMVQQRVLRNTASMTGVGVGVKKSSSKSLLSLVRSTSTSNTNVSVASKSTDDGVLLQQQHQHQQQSVLLKDEERLFRAKRDLCPLKLRLAMLLMDLGDTAQAGRYVTELKRIVHTVNTQQGKSRIKSGGGSNATTSGGATGSSSSSSSSQWGGLGLGLMSTLKGLVDDTDKDTGPGPGPGPFYNNNSHSQSQYQSQSNPPHPPPPHPPLRSSSSMNTLSTENNNNRGGGAGGNITATSDQSQSHHSHGHSHSHSALPPPSPSAPANTPVSNTKSKSVSAPDSGKEKSSTVSSSGGSGDKGGGGEGTGTGLVGKVRQGLLKLLYPDAVDAQKHMGNSLEAYFDKNTGQWVFPGEENQNVSSAASAPPPTGPIPSPNTGPGSGPGAFSRSVSQPALSMTSTPTAPGVTGHHPQYPPHPQSQSHHSHSQSSSFGPPSQSQSQTSGGHPHPHQSYDVDTAPYDPIAALMAPPPRSLPGHTPSFAAAMDADPLSALMAPPPMRSIPGGYSASAAPVSRSSAGPPMMPQFWTPPPVAVPVSVSVSSVQGDGGGGGGGGGGEVQTTPMTSTTPTTPMNMFFPMDVVTHTNIIMSSSTSTSSPSALGPGPSSDSGADFSFPTVDTAGDSGGGGGVMGGGGGPYGTVNDNNHDNDNGNDSGSCDGLVGSSIWEVTMLNASSTVRCKVKRTY
eukprot:gene4695-9307_t